MLFSRVRGELKTGTRIKTGFLSLVTRSHIQIRFNKINIKNQKTRWGSCSKKGNLNFNYKIALLPQHLADYIIVHELCHLGEFNHSRSFWNLVAKVFPEYLGIRNELRRSGIHFI